MLISQKVVTAINEQIGNEFNAFLQYVGIASHFDAEALPELSSYFYRQADEERGHALKFVKFVNEAGGHITIPAIPSPKTTFKTVEEAVKMSLEREIEVTRQINSLVALAKSEKDYTSDNFLQWFVREQLEEVSTMEVLLRVVQRATEANLLRVEEYLARKAGRMTPGTEEAV